MNKLCDFSRCNACVSLPAVTGGSHSEAFATCCFSFDYLSNRLALFSLVLEVDCEPLTHSLPRSHPYILRYSSILTSRLSLRNFLTSVLIRLLISLRNGFLVKYHLFQCPSLPHVFSLYYSSFHVPRPCPRHPISFLDQLR